MTLEPEQTDPEAELTGPQDVQPSEETAEESQIDDPYESPLPEETEELDPEPARPPALVINIQSWATPIAAVLMLFVGLLGGFFARPLIDPEPTPTPQPAAVAQPPAGAAQSQQSQQAQQQAQASPEDRAALMNALLPQVRHFKGSPDAPVTLIEFSDFQ